MRTCISEFVGGCGHADKSMLLALGIWRGRVCIAPSFSFASRRAFVTKSSMLFAPNIQDLAEKMSMINHWHNLQERPTKVPPVMCVFWLFVKKPEPEFCFLLARAKRTLCKQLTKRLCSDSKDDEAKEGAIGLWVLCWMNRYLIMNVVSAICSQTVGGPKLPGRSCTADFGADSELMCRDSILFASISKLTRTTNINVM